MDVRSLGLDSARNTLVWGDFNADGICARTFAAWDNYNAFILTSIKFPKTDVEKVGCALLR